LGDAAAHYQLSCLYRDGQGVENDEKKQMHHLEEAAIGGHPDARHNLGCIEGKHGSHERATKHLIIAATLGHDDSLETLKKGYKAGFVSKEDFVSLRGHQAAVDETKSPQR
jgi:TPR repeat protein